MEERHRERQGWLTGCDSCGGVRGLEPKKDTAEKPGPYSFHETKICIGILIATDSDEQPFSGLHCCQIKHSVGRQCRSCSLLLVADESFHREVKNIKPNDV
jgi:hypothetical protein